MKTSSFTLGSVSFTPTLLSTLLILLIIPLFVYLGCWQLGRASTKQQLQTQQKSHSQNNKITLESSLKYTEALRYRLAEAEGTLMNENHILLDNQIVKGRIGYRVLTPLKLANSNAVVLIDRGFIPIQHTRTKLPHISPVPGIITLQGIINQPANPLALGPSLNLEATEWPLRIQILRYKELAGLLDSPVIPLLLQLKDNDPRAFTPIPISFPLSAEKHLGYAMQWFMMALAVFIYYCISNCQRKTTNDQP